MKPAHVVIVVFVLWVAVCFALGFDRIMIGLLATGGGVAAEATRRRKKAEAELTDATGDRDRQLGALRAAMARADDLARRQAELDDEAADVHRAADDALEAARKLDAE
jgi:biopolymer transport protein ExbB/TolQ